MNVLDSPLEALAINYFHFGFHAVVNNLWAWLTVVTAALSIWRIRAAASSAAFAVPDLPFAPPREHERPTESSSDRSDNPTPTVAAAAAVSPSPTKGRFTTYFEHDSGEDAGSGWFEEEEEEEAEEEAAEVNGGCGGGGEWWFGWERLLRERSGEVGWYRCQDLSALDGNIVRLWDDHRQHY